MSEGGGAKKGGKVNKQQLKGEHVRTVKLLRRYSKMEEIKSY